MAEVVLNGICKSFREQHVIDNLSLRIADGQFVSLLGPSGCGKTTLLRMIAGLESIDKGELLIGGKRCTDLAPQKRRIAMVFQSYALFPHLTVKSNILFGLRMRKVPSAVMQQKLTWCSELLGLSALLGRLPRELSGGQRQRVALARAIVLDPDVMLLDEPLSNLDTALRETAIEELKRLHRSVGKTIIYVTHNQAEAMTMSEHIALLDTGRLVQYDTPKKVYDEPASIYTAQFIGYPGINIIEGCIDECEGQVGIRTPACFLALDRERGSSLAGSIGRKVFAGIRPQHITLAQHYASRRSSDTPVEVTVEMVENLGDRSLVVGRRELLPALRFLVTRDVEIAVDSRLALFIDGRRIHLFDPESGGNLFAANS